MIFMVMGAIGCRTNITDADIKAIGLTEVGILIAEAERNPERRVLLLIDPRSPSKFRAGHLPGARNVLLSDVPTENRPRAIDTFEHVVVYGDNAADAAAISMTKRLLALEYNNPRMFRIGLSGWTEAGLEVVSESEPDGAELSRP